MSDEIFSGFIVSDGRQEERAPSKATQTVRQISSDTAVRAADASAMRASVHLQGRKNRRKRERRPLVDGPRWISSS